MNFDSQLKLLAYIDGELSPREARQTEAWLAENQEANLLLAELQKTKAVLAGHESEAKVPESREFYWQKIESRIRSQRDSRTQINVASLIFVWGRKYLFPASAVVALLAMALIMTKRFTSPSNPTPSLAENQARQFPEFESPSENTRGFTFRDHSAGMSLVWISYRDDERFTDEDLLDTVQ